MVVTLGNHCVVFLSKCVDPRPRNCCVELPPRNDCVKEWPFHGGNVLLGNCLEKWLFCLAKWQVVDCCGMLVHISLPWGCWISFPNLQFSPTIIKLCEIFNFLVRFHNEPKIMDDDCIVEEHFHDE
jgi:hypothetical protein